MQKIKVDKWEALLWIDTTGYCTISDAGKSKTIVTETDLDKAKSKFIDQMTDYEFKERLAQIKSKK